MKLSWLILLSVLWAQNSWAEVSSGINFVRSRSGQFAARALQDSAPMQAVPRKGVPAPGGWAVAAVSPPGAASGQLRLEPALTVVSCERLKQLLLNELQLQDQWRGRIQILIDSLLPEDAEPELTVIREPGGWTYELLVPTRIKSFRFFRALVNAMLLEIANRGAGGESAQIPLWLAEGMTAHLQAENLPVFVVQPETTLIASRVSTEALGDVRKLLREKTPLTFDQLSWPGNEEIAGTNDAYRACAQLFVCELLRFRDGPERLGRMLNELPNYLNWQVAFLRAFDSHFSQLLQVEKWWGLVCVNFTTRDAKAAWPAEESLRRLRDVLDIPVQVHLSPERLPAPAMITLQEVIMEWEKAEATATIQRTVQALLALHPRLAPEAAALAGAYRNLLETYLRQDAKSPLLRAVTHSSLQKRICSRLSALDEQRSSLSAALAKRKPPKTVRQSHPG